MINRERLQIDEAVKYHMTNQKNKGQQTVNEDYS